MPNNKNKNRRKAVVNKPKPKPVTPFADAGSIVGSKLGTMFNAPYLKGVGKWLGSGIGQIFGSGDYQLVGSNPAYNVLFNGNQIPKFSSSKQTNIVCHREYLGDILGTAAFNNNSYPLNPGIAKTFPWLSTIAQNYQEYKFHGIIFEFRSLVTDFVTNGAPGVVVMATNYNADALPYTTKQEMENSEYAVSVKPTRELMHGVECEAAQTVLPQLFIRSGIPPAGQDLRLYDLGNFQFATQSNPIQNLGELWVSYCVEFYKPILPVDVGGNVLTGVIQRQSVSPGAPLGTIQFLNIGDIGMTIASSSIISIPTQPGNFYLLQLSWLGSIAGAITAPAISASAGTIFVGSGAVASQFPANGIVCDRFMVSALFRGDLSASSVAVITVGFAGVFPTGTTTVEIMVTQFSSEAIG
jgi:hypothetical protein